MAPPPLSLGDGRRSGWLQRLSEWQPPSPASSSSSSSSSSTDDRNGLLELVEVISVESSDEDDGHVVVPLQVLVKRETPADGSSTAKGGGGGGGGSHETVVKNERELRAADAHDRNFFVDLCSEDSDSDNERNTVAAARKGSSGVRGFTYELVSDNSDGGSDERRAGSRSDGGRNMILRFKRRKVRHNSAGGGSAEEVTAGAAELSSDSDSEAYVSDTCDEVDEDSVVGDDEISDEDDDDDNLDDGVDNGHSRLGPTQSSASHSLSRAQVDAIIRSDVQKLEAEKPWRFVYRCLEVPFQVDCTTDAFDLLFERWDAFWKVFGRAVWERYFWVPLPTGSLEYRRRKHRQWRAARTFRVLAAELYEKLGQGFLRQVSRQAHDGWWYRSPPLMLRELFNLDRRKYGMYMTLYRERFPRGSRFERSLDASWCLDSVLSAENDACCAHVDLAHKAWQDVTRSEDNENDDACDADDESS